MVSIVFLWSEYASGLTEGVSISWLMKYGSGVVRNGHKSCAFGARG